MKQIIAAFFLSVSSFAIAAPTKVICTTDNNEKYVSTLAQLNVDEMWTCEEGFRNSDVCYVGKRSEAIKIIKQLENNDVMGDEYRLRNIRATGSVSIEYNVWDGPNDMIIDTAIVGPCH